MKRSLQELRESRNMTRTQLALELHPIVHPHTIYRWERPTINRAIGVEDTQRNDFYPSKRYLNQLIKLFGSELDTAALQKPKHD